MVMSLLKIIIVSAESEWGTHNLIPSPYYYTCPVDRIQSPLWAPVKTKRLSEPFCLPKPHFVSNPVQMFLIASNSNRFL